MIQYGAQSIDGHDLKAVAQTLRSAWLTQGPQVTKFEAALASYTGAKYAVAVSNGTAALHLAYLAAGLGAGDEVITTPNTFVATTNMLLAVGAKPIFCDIRLDTYNLDEQQIEKLITKRTRAIVTVDFAGQPCEYRRIRALAKKHKLILIDDGCHALGATYHGRPIGSLADLTVFSFHPVKAITTGEGGAILTNNPKFYQRLLHLRSHGISKDRDGFGVMTDLGYNYRLTDIQAALGRSQLQRLPAFAQKRRQVVEWYRTAFGQTPAVILPTPQPGTVSANHLYIIRTKLPVDRLPLYRYLRERGVGVNFHYPAVFSHPYYRARGFDGVQCPNSKLYAATAMTLPLHTKLSRSDVRFIVRTINDYFRD